MEKRDFSQLELFSQTKKYSQTKMNTPRTFLNYIRNYEKIILVIIGFIITGIVSFSLGVEKGKRLAILKSDSYLDMAKSRKQDIPKQDIPKSAEKDIGKHYTVQVASFQTRKYAQKEAEVLTKKGFSPLVLSKGKYSILCVGKFSSRETAKPLLSKLKQRYRDCFVRKL